MPAHDEGEIGWYSASLAGGYSLALLLGGVVAPLVGAWIDRHGPRGLMVTGALAGSIGVAARSAAHTLAKAVGLVGFALVLEVTDWSWAWPMLTLLLLRIRLHC
ncbi:MAG: hypothetical protein MPN21_25450 [Thermoanaerobaculia bacterium]|nr:hypothetical protein [Thermoanaerobaculia bacterium]